MPTSIQSPERRIGALDGIRGLMTVAVVLSHYFAEISGGVHRLSVAWVAVDVFFVLSGFLVGRLILDKGHHSNFYGVFYARRICRTFPIYFACLTVGVLLPAFVPALVSEGAASVPAWSYFTFLQNLFMAASGTIGTEWLAPTWTLAVEEQFYLVVPALMLATPRRWLPLLLWVICLSAIAARYRLAAAGHECAALSLLPTRADCLAFGLIAAVASRSRSVDWTSAGVRAIPIAALVVAFASKVLLSGAGFDAISHAAVSGGAACFLLSIAAGAPEARRFEGKVLAFFGNNSYATYLTHMPILWVAHAALFGAAPALSGAASVLVNALCLPVCALAAWLLTRCVEEPITALGRRIKWAGAPRAAPAEMTSRPAEGRA